MAKRFVYSEGTSHKFWEVSQVGCNVQVHYGRIGTAGQESVRAEKTPEAAASAIDKLIREKLKKGYKPAAASTSKAMGADKPNPVKARDKAKPVTKNVTKKPVKASEKGASHTGASELPAGVSMKRPKRTESLMCLSGSGQIPVELKDALRFADRARYISVDSPAKDLLKLRRVHKLETAGAIPSWFSQLRHLRSLQCIGSFKKLPSALAALPHLQYLHLEESDLESLEGVETFPALRNITLGSTPIAEDPEALAAMAKKIKGATFDEWLCGLEFSRVARPAPKDRKKLLQALRDDALDDQSDLRKVDLSGERFEDLYVTHDLRGANLANTVWVRCDFYNAKLAGADLRGATFYDCSISGGSHEKDGNLGKVKAQKATLIGCDGDLDFRGADLSGARLLDLEPDVCIDLSGSKAEGLILETSFCSEKEHSIEAKGANLRGAQITFDITPGRRAEIAKKNSRFAWAKNQLRGAKLDKSTQVHYAPLDGSQPKAKASTLSTRPGDIDPKGPAAEQLAMLFAANASLWAIVADANDVGAWRGAVDENDKHDDFQTALRSKADAPIAIGKAKGVLTRIGYNAYSPIFRIDGGVMLVDYSISLDDRKKECLALAQRVAQWSLPMPPKVFAKLTVHSGVLAILLPYTSGAFTPKQIAQAKAGKVYEEPRDHDRVLLPMPNGVYELAHVPFRPVKGKGAYEDEIGEYEMALTIRKAK